MSRCSDAAAWVLETGATYLAASKRFGVAAQAIRATVRRRQARRLSRLAGIDLAVALVAAGAATTRKAAAIYGLRAEDVLAAFNARYPQRARVMT